MSDQTDRQAQDDPIAQCIQWLSFMVTNQADRRMVQAELESIAALLRERDAQIASLTAQFIERTAELDVLKATVRGLPPTIAAGLIERLRAERDAVEPFLVVLRNNSEGRSLDQPLPALTAGGEHMALVQPFMLGQQSGAEPRLVDEPTPTIATKGAISLIEPFLVSFYGSGVNVSSTREPLRTVTTKDRHGLVQPSQIDITFRMLRPHELAAAMGFPTSYQFAGTRTDAVKQIGNAVEVNQAAALWAGPVAQVAGARRAA